MENIEIPQFIRDNLLKRCVTLFEQITEYVNQIAEIEVAKSQPQEYDLARSEQAYACYEGLEKESRGTVGELANLAANAIDFPLRTLCELGANFMPI